MTHAMIAEVLFDGAVAFFCGYQVGKLRGWERGFKEGNEMGHRFGVIRGKMDAMGIPRPAPDGGRP